MLLINVKFTILPKQKKITQNNSDITSDQDTPLSGINQGYEEVTIRSMSFYYFNMNVVYEV